MGDCSRFELALALGLRLERGESFAEGVVIESFVVAEG